MTANANKASTLELDPEPEDICSATVCLLAAHVTMLESGRVAPRLQRAEEGNWPSALEIARYPSDKKTARRFLVLLEALCYPH